VSWQIILVPTGPYSLIKDVIAEVSVRGLNIQYHEKLEIDMAAKLSNVQSFSLAKKMTSAFRLPEYGEYIFEVLVRPASNQSKLPGNALHGGSVRCVLKQLQLPMELTSVTSLLHSVVLSEGSTSTSPILVLAWSDPNRTQRCNLLQNTHQIPVMVGGSHIEVIIQTRETESNEWSNHSVTKVNEMRNHHIMQTSTDLQDKQVRFAVTYVLCDTFDELRGPSVYTAPVTIPAMRRLKHKGFCKNSTPKSLENVMSERTSGKSTDENELHRPDSDTERDVNSVNGGKASELQARNSEETDIEENEPCAACVICGDDMLPQPQSYPIIPGQCNHLFHAKCLLRWALKKPTCPLCCAPFSAVTFYNTKLKAFCHITLSDAFRKINFSTELSPEQGSDGPSNLPLLQLQLRGTYLTRMYTDSHFHTGSGLHLMPDGDPDPLILDIITRTLLDA